MRKFGVPMGLLMGAGEMVARMPMIMKETSIAASAPYANLLSGSQFEFSKGRGVASFGIAQSATGLFCVIQAGADIIAEEFAPPILTRYPIIPDEMYFTDVVESGDRLAVSVRNSTAGALTARAVVQLSVGG